ncbi:MAG: alcohol dehydrogenase catalytic domain-containing protein [Firmicutes bacterium]|nr:alcohol dehydrogenase catalytic domain-containing protein [Bacillota bacterium]
MIFVNALILRAIGDVVYATADDPDILEDGDAVIRTRVTAICGSDLHLYHGRVVGVNAPIALGHEYVGIVEAVGPAVKRIQVGDRVTGAFATACGRCASCLRGLSSQCQAGQLFGFGQLPGTQAERVRIPYADSTLIKVPPGVSDAQGLLVGDNLSTAYFACEGGDIRPNDTVAVVGLGPVGLLALNLAWVFGAARVIAIDTVPTRLQVAEKLGAVPVMANERTVGRVRNLTGGHGADVVVEAVGLETSLNLALEIARGFATVSAVGAFTEKRLPVAMRRVFARNLTLKGGLANVLSVAPRVMDLLENGRLDLSWLFSHHLPLRDGPRGYQLFSRRDALKVLLYPH